MSLTLQGRIKAHVRLVEQDTAKGAGDAPATFVHEAIVNERITNGTSDAGTGNRVYSDESTVVDGAPVSIDLAGSLSALTGGGTVTFVDLAGLYIEHTSGAGNLHVGAGSNPVPLFGDVSDLIKIPPGGKMMLWTDSSLLATVTAATGDILRLLASTGTVGYKIIIWGRSA